MPQSKLKDTKDQKLETLCKNCGQEFSAFLHQMEEHNAKVVVCPSCGQVHDYNNPPKTAEVPVRKKA